MLCEKARMKIISALIIAQNKNIFILNSFFLQNKTAEFRKQLRWYQKTLIIL